MGSDAAVLAEVALDVVLDRGEDRRILAPIEHYVEGDLGEHGGVVMGSDAGDDAGSDEPAATSIDR